MAGERSPATVREQAFELKTDRFSRSVEAYLRALRLDVAQAVKKVAFEFEGRVKEKTPVDTGRLRASIHTVVFDAPDAYAYEAPARHGGPAVSWEGRLVKTPPPQSATEAVVGTNVEYAMPVELGTPTMAARGMFALAMAEMRGQMREAIISVRRGRR